MCKTNGGQLTCIFIPNSKKSKNWNARQIKMYLIDILFSPWREKKGFNLMLFLLLFIGGLTLHVNTSLLVSGYYPFSLRIWFLLKLKCSWKKYHWKVQSGPEKEGFENKLMGGCGERIWKHEILNFRYDKIWVLAGSR